MDVFSLNFPDVADDLDLFSLKSSSKVNGKSPQNLIVLQTSYYIVQNNIDDDDSEKKYKKQHFR